MPTASAKATLVVAPFDHAYVYVGVPPVTNAKALPELNPEQPILFPAIVIDNGAGSVITTD